MKISIITLFPKVFKEILGSSIIGRAQVNNILQLEFINLRDFGIGRHQVVDDRPYGGGVGMVLKADVLAEALNSIKVGKGGSRVILTSASGTTYTQRTAKRLSKYVHLIIICGHYEGVDQRFIDKYVDEEISIGDYILTGGEIPAMVIIDSAVRLISGVILKPEAVKNESFENGLLEYPHFTRPEDFEGVLVPGVLLSGNHKKIADFKIDASLRKTGKLRPDLLKKV